MSHETQSAEPGTSIGRQSARSLPAYTVRRSVVLIALAVIVVGCAGNDGVDRQVTMLGTVEVTARLMEIPGEFLSNDGFYNYAFVLKYAVLEVHRGEVATKEIVVAHYNPRKPRSLAADEDCANLGGTLTTFRAGDVHRMALEVPYDQFYIGGLVDRFFDQDQGPIHWAVWTNLVN